MRSTLLAAATAFAVGTTYAQFDGPGSEDGPNNSTELGGTPTVQEGNRTIHYIDAAKGGHYYQPNSIQAEVGDIVSFRFYPSNHSVVRAEYRFPCIPYEDVVPDGVGFDSGFFEETSISANPPTWNLTVDSTEPIFFYCGAPGSCLDWGMVGVINANATQDIATQISLAKSADYMLLPGEPFPDEAISSMSSVAETATVAPTTAATQASSTVIPPHGHESQESSGLSGGVIAGIVVGAVAVIAIIAALFFLLRRTKKMTNRLEEREKREQQERQSQQMNMGGPPSWMPPPTNQGYFNPNNPHHSGQLPPYGHPDHHFYEQKPVDETMSLASGPMSPPLRGQSPPVPEMGQHAMHGFQTMPQNPHHSYDPLPMELPAGTPMAAEIYTPNKDATSSAGHPAHNKP